MPVVHLGCTQHASDRLEGVEGKGEDGCTPRSGSVYFSFSLKYPNWVLVKDFALALMLFVEYCKPRNKAGTAGEARSRGEDRA